MNVRTIQMCVPVRCARMDTGELSELVEYLAARRGQLGELSEQSATILAAAQTELTARAAA